MLTVGNLCAFFISFPLLYQKNIVMEKVDSRWWNVIFALPVASSCFVLLIFTYCYPLDTPIFYYLTHDLPSVPPPHP